MAIFSKVGFGGHLAAISITSNGHVEDFCCIISVVIGEPKAIFSKVSFEEHLAALSVTSNGHAEDFRFIISLVGGIFNGNITQCICHSLKQATALNA